MKDVKDFINNSYSGVSGSPIVDPLSDAGKTRGTGTGLAVLEDETTHSNYPKITIYTININRSRMAGGKSEYRERFRHQFAIRYTCHKQHTWTYNSIAHKGKQQCIKYLQYLGDQLKKYSGSFEDFNEVTLGDISNPVPEPDTHTYSSFMPIKIDTHGRVGD